VEAFQVFAETYLIPAQLAFALLGMGAALSVQDFLDVARNPVGLTIGVLLQMVGVPLIALGYSEALGMEPGWAVGLLLVALVPGGALSNLLTFLARGNTALSISMTIIATTSCIITIPIALRLLAPAHLPPDFDIPTGKIVFDIGVYLLTPLVIGMIIYRLRPSLAEHVSRWSIRLSLVLLLAIVVSSLGSGRISLPEYGWMPPLRILIFCGLLAIGIPHICRLLGRYDDESVAIGIEVCVRNVGVGLLIFQFFFPGEAEQGHVLFSLLFYSGISAFFAVPLLLLHRRGHSPVLGLGRYARPEVERLAATEPG